MAKYYYKGKNIRGEIIRGFYEADGASQVSFMLRQRGFFPYYIEKRSIYHLLMYFENFIYNNNPSQLAIFCRQLASLLNIGLPVLDSLILLQKQAANRRFSKAINDIITNIKLGFSISVGFKQHPEIFPDMFFYMVEVGEHSGQLDKVLMKLAYYYEQMSSHSEKIKNALIYPCILFVTSIFTVVFLISEVLPVFTHMLHEAGAELPFITNILIKLIFFTKKYLLVFLVLLILFAYLFYIFTTTKVGAQVIDRLIFKIPLIGVIRKKSIAVQFCSTLSILISSGIPLIKAIEICKNSTNSTVFRNTLEQANYALKKGRNLHEVLNPDLFPAMMIRMVGIGEETGALENLLMRTASIYETEIQNLQNRLVTVIEPCIIILLSLVVGFIIFSLVLPMFNLYNIY